MKFLSQEQVELALEQAKEYYQNEALTIEQFIYEFWGLIEATDEMNSVQGSIEIPKGTVL